MLELAYPWALTLAPLPLLVWWLWPPHREPVSAIRVPFFAALSEASGELPREGSVVLTRQSLQMIVAGLVWLLLVVALAKPQWAGEPIEKTDAARDVMLAIDLSGSMDERDFGGAEADPTSRLDVVKRVVGAFIDKRHGDRIGIIVFGSKAYVQVPFTQDLATAKALLEATEVGMAGPHTALGDAIGLSIRTFEASEVEQRLLIVLTDGSDTGSRMTPINAAEIASRNGISIFAVGVGDVDADGEDRVDFETLEAIARRTNGQFFTADDSQGLAAVYERIEAMVPRETKTVSYRPRRSLVHWPAGAAAVLGILACLALLGMRRMRETA